MVKLMTLVSVVRLLAVVVVEMASATDYPATWALADHGTVPAATVYALTTTSNVDTKYPGTMSSGDVNGDGINDFSYELPTGTLNVHFGGISADLDLDGITYSGSNGFSIVTGNSGDIWGTIAGDVNNDGFNDVLFYHAASSSVKIIFGKASGWSASYTVASMMWDGTDGYQLTYSGDSKFGSNSYGGYAPQILTNFDINNDGIDDIAVLSSGTSNSGRVSIFFGKSTWSASVDGSSDFDGSSSGFSVMDSANARLGRGLAMGDINGDGIDDIVVSSRSSQPSNGAGCVYVLFGGGTYPASITDIYSHVDGTTGFRLCGAETNYLGDYFVTVLDFNGDGMADVLFAGRGTADGLYLLFGRASFSASMSLPIASGEGVTFTGLSSPAFVSPPNLGNFNDDQYDDTLLVQSGNMYVVFGSASPTDTIDVTTLSGTDGFELTDSEILATKFYHPIDMTGDGSTDLPLYTQSFTPSFSTVTSLYLIEGNGPAAGGTQGGTSTTVSTTITTSGTITRTTTVTTTITTTNTSTLDGTSTTETATTTSTITATKTMSTTTSGTTSVSTSFTTTDTTTITTTRTTATTTTFTASITTSVTNTFTNTHSTTFTATTTTTITTTSSTMTRTTATVSTTTTTTIMLQNTTVSEDNNAAWVILSIVLVVAIITCSVAVHCCVVKIWCNKEENTQDPEQPTDPEHQGAGEPTHPAESSSKDTICL